MSKLDLKTRVRVLEAQVKLLQEQVQKMMMNADTTSEIKRMG